MVRYYDDKGIYDAPVGEVWKLLEAHTDENMPKIHPAFHSAKTIAETGDTVDREVEFDTPEGKTEHAKLRMTAKPPRALTIEYLSGPFEGSWFTNAYVPEADGKRTRVVCTGDFHVKGMDETKALATAREMLDARFDEDAKYLDTMG